MATKEELLHEINIVTVLSEKYDMKDPANAGRVAKFFETKSAFKTPVGIQYLERLHQIESGGGDAPCFICKKVQAYDGVLCETCMSKYSHGKRDFYGKAHVSESVSPNTSAKEQIGSMVDSAKTKMSEFSSKVQNRLKEEDIQKTKKEISGKLAVFWDKLKAWWKKRKRWQKIVIFAVFAGLVLGIVFSRCGGGSVIGSSSHSGSASSFGIPGSVKSIEDARKAVESVFLPEAYVIKEVPYSSNAERPCYWFLGEPRVDVNEIDDSHKAWDVYADEYNKTGNVPVYCFTVHSSNFSETYNVEVSESGRVVVNDLDAPGLYSLVK